MLNFKFKRKHFLLLLIIMFLVSPVFAADEEHNIDDNIKDVEYEINEKVNNQQVINDNNIKEYNKSVKEASNPSYYITNKNINNYFDEDGCIINDAVKNGSTLILNDTFKNKSFYFIDSEITLSGMNNKTVLLNSEIYVEGSPVKIKNLIINNTNTETPAAIYIESNNCEIENCIINVYSTNDCYGIYLLGNNTNIMNNNINVSGPSDEINWDTDVARTLSLIVLSNNNKITGNNISVYASVDKANPGTIEAVSLQGDYEGHTSKNNTFTNNRIIGEGNSFVYGVNLGNTVDNNIINNNYIYTNGGYFADALQIFSTVSNTTINNNTITSISNVLADGIVISKDNMQGKTDNNNITNNKINVTGYQTNLIEIYRSTNTRIINNTVESNANITNGITATGSNIVIKNNNIKLNSKDNTTNSIVAIDSENVSITNNIVKSNCVYSVNLGSSTKSNVTDNVLDSIIKGDKSVKYTDKSNIIKNNNDSIVIATITKTTNITAKINDQITLTANVTAADNSTINQGYVIFKVNNQSLTDKNNTLIKAYVKNGVAQINYTVDKSWNKDKISIIAIYSGSGSYLSSKSDSQKINVSKRTAHLEVITDKLAVQGGDTILLSALVLENNTQINGGKVIFKLNGQTLKDKKGNSLIVDVKNGLAKTNYTFDYGFSAKNCNITAIYSSNIYDRAEANNTIYINKSNQLIKVNITKTKSNVTRIIAQLVEVNGIPIKGITQVAIKINDQTFAVVAAQNGTVNTTINTKFKVGSYTLKLVAGENNRYLANTAITVLEKTA